MPFYILKEGIYLHGVYGPYQSKEDALSAFKRAYDATEENNDFDGYHNYYIIDKLPDDVGSGMSMGKEQIHYESKKEI